jgi:pimeloyl-ACP methyl ester carboxylesterase
MDGVVPADSACLGARSGGASVRASERELRQNKPARLAPPARYPWQFAAFAQDTIDNQRLVAQGKLKVPVLAIGGDHSYGRHLATEIGFAASDVRAAVIEDSGHWIMEEQPEQAVTIILSFLKGQ